MLFLTICLILGCLLIALSLIEFKKDATSKQFIQATVIDCVESEDGVFDVYIELHNDTKDMYVFPSKVVFPMDAVVNVTVNNNIIDIYFDKVNEAELFKVFTKREYLRYTGFASIIIGLAGFLFMHNSSIMMIGIATTIVATATLLIARKAQFAMSKYRKDVEDGKIVEVNGIKLGYDDHKNVLIAYANDEGKIKVVNMKNDNSIQDECTLMHHIESDTIVKINTKSLKVINVIAMASAIIFSIISFAIFLFYNANK